MPRGMRTRAPQTIGARVGAFKDATYAFLGTLSEDARDMVMEEINQTVQGWKVLGAPIEPEGEEAPASAPKAKKARKPKKAQAAAAEAEQDEDTQAVPA